MLRKRFGLEDGRARTLEEVGRCFGVTRERIRQIEAKALRKLRHPKRLHEAQGLPGIRIRASRMTLATPIEAEPRTPVLTRPTVAVVYTHPRDGVGRHLARDGTRRFHCRPAPGRPDPAQDKHILAALLPGLLHQSLAVGRGDSRSQVLRVRRPCSDSQWHRRR